MRTRIEEQRIVPRFRSRHPFCQRCKWRRSVQTHHLRYDCLWEEPPSALLAVCLQCHKRLEAEKAVARRRKA